MTIDIHSHTLEELLLMLEEGTEEIILTREDEPIAALTYLGIPISEPEAEESEEIEEEELSEAVSNEEIPHAVHYNGRVLCPKCRASLPYSEGICTQCGCLFLPPEGEEE